MLNTIKSSSLFTKLLYITAFVLFIVWILPTISGYYTAVNNYKESVKELESFSTQHGVSAETQKFSESAFKYNTELLFSKVEIKNLGAKLYKVNIKMKKEDLKSFHAFIESIALRYYVEIKDAIQFTSQEENINVKMILEAF